MIIGCESKIVQEPFKNDAAEKCPPPKTGQQQSLLSAGMWQTSANLITGLLGWLLILIISREDIGLGVTGVGLFNTGMIIFYTLSVVVLGIKKSTSQKISENCINEEMAIKEAVNGNFAIFLTCILMGIGLLSISIFIFAPSTFQDELSFSIFIIGIFALVMWFREGTQSVLAGIGQYNSIAKSNLILFSTQFLLGILLVFMIRLTILPLIAIFLSYGGAIFVQSLLLSKYIKKHQRYSSKMFHFQIRDRALAKNLRQGSFFAVTEIIPSNILSQVSFVILFIFVRDFAISGAYSLTIGYAIGGLLVTNFTWPLITHIAEAYSKGDSEKIHYHLTLVLKIFYYVTFFIATVSIGASQGILYTFYGDTYLTGATDIWIPFILVMITTSITAFEYVLSSVFLGIGKRRPAAIYFGMLFLLTIGFTSGLLYWNPFSPQINVSVGYLLAALVLLPIIPRLLRKELDQKISYAFGFRSFAASLCTFLICFILVWPPLNLLPITNPLIFISLFPLLACSYVFFLVFFGSVSQKDLDLLERKIANARVKKYIVPLLGLLRRIMAVSPFCSSS